MPNYTGSSCPICGKLFAATDDIVVCPDCGAPHHRECYKTVGHCGNQEEHAGGYQWQAPAQETAETPPQDRVACRSCGADNPAGNFFCEACGQRILGDPQQGAQAQQQAAAFGGYFGGANLDFTQVLDRGVTVKEACDYVGPNAIPFAFKFKRTIYGGISFNWGAFLFGFFYCFYRRMYKLGGVLLAVFLLTLIPGCYFSILAIQDIINATGTLALPLDFITEGAGYQGLLMVSAVNQVVSIATRAFVGFFFDKLYCKQMLQKVTAVRESGRVSPGTQDYTYAVAASGGVSRGAVLVLIASIFAIYLAVGYLSSYFIIM